MKFGKQIQAEQVPGWSAYYLDYKFLKKIISSLASDRPVTESAAVALGVRPADLLSTPVPIDPLPVTPVAPASIFGDADQPPIFAPSDKDDARGPRFQAHKAAFFFKLERELEKINAFYLKKEDELKTRLETLLAKRRAAVLRVLPNSTDDSTQNHVEWTAVEEGFRMLERDLSKLEQFVEINATGFRKILKKWDKRSKSTTKELYLSRQVDVQPVFNRQLISELTDTVAACLMDITDLSTGYNFEKQIEPYNLTHPPHSDRAPSSVAFRDLESNFRRAVASNDRKSITELVGYADLLAQEPGGQTNTSRILWKVIIDAPPDLADLVLSSMTTPFDFHFIDDINGRTCLHEAAIAGAPRLVDLCLKKGILGAATDVYGRSALHYAAMNGHADICRRLLEDKVPSNTVDLDNYSPLTYASLHGSAACVEVLLAERVVFDQLLNPASDLNPLSLASQSGHLEIVQLLLKRGARSIPNTNGEFPIHLAVKAGHAAICTSLLECPGWDLPDRYHEWTPLFHAARHGRDACIVVLLQAGARVKVLDEFGHLPVHYAAWYGHHICAHKLLDAMVTVTTSLPTQSPLETAAKTEAANSADVDVDLIPSLSLPPPIMPHRVYGHNYLDKACLVQVTLASSTGEAAVELHHRLINSADDSIPALKPLKLVMTNPLVDCAPHAVSLPQQNEGEIFSFQMPNLASLALQFSLYPMFGTRLIGRAYFMCQDPSSPLLSMPNEEPISLPILDSRLHVIGKVSFLLSVVTPFAGATLEVGGAVETYWKSIVVDGSEPQAPTSLPATSSLTALSSTHTSPSALSVAGSDSHTSTISSVTGEFAYLTVQVTRDHHPVCYPRWLLPSTEFDLGVADVTLTQFSSLADRIGAHPPAPSSYRVEDWRDFCVSSMISLKSLLQVLPVEVGLFINVAYTTPDIIERYSLKRSVDSNRLIDALLKVINDSAPPSLLPVARRRIAFTSFHPQICAALNWKQPNYPVVFSSLCGRERELPCDTALNTAHSRDRWLTSLATAVEFAKLNNLLGIFVDAGLLDEVPSVLQSAKDAGLLVGVYHDSRTNVFDPKTSQMSLDLEPEDESNIVEDSAEAIPTYVPEHPPEPVSIYLDLVPVEGVHSEYIAYMQNGLVSFSDNPLHDVLL